MAPRHAAGKQDWRRRQAKLFVRLRLQSHFVDDAPEGDPPDLDGARDSGKVPG
jgi:hypothetical protein